MSMHNQELGAIGEELAARELEAQWYAILARRYRTRHGEIDIVARDGETVVFVEVKARATAELGRAAEAITPWKQRRLASMAAEYLARQHVDECPCRFDVVAVDEADGPAPLITVFRNAFEVA
jgi:putative endonuclease